MTSSDIRSALRAAGERELRRDEIETLLRVSEEDAGEVTARAGELARERFGRGVFVYGFVYLSTNCVNDCTFCHNRSGNESSVRYRKSGEEITEAVHRLADEGASCVDLTCGEDEVLANGGWEELRAPVESAVSHGMAVMVSPGVVGAGVLRKLRDWGADWYALYQESYEPELYDALRPNQPARERVKVRQAARQEGLFTEDGLLMGVGETAGGLAGGLLSMGESRQVRAMCFIPQPGITHPGATPPPWRELLVTAVLRLCHPDSLVPATLDSNGAGIVERLDAGANVVTSCIPPGMGLRGVARPTRGIEDGSRSVTAVREELRRAGFKPSSCGEYINWLDEKRPG